METLSYFLVAAFAVFRLSRLLRKEAAPFQLARRFRTLVGLHRKDGVEHIVNRNPVLRQIPQALQCVYCTSVWLSLGATLLIPSPSLGISVLLWLGISGLASGIDFVVEAVDEYTEASRAARGLDDED